MIVVVYILIWYLLQENKNDLLQIICAYGVMPIPERGSGMVFQPHEHLQSIRYLRPSFSDLLSVAGSAGSLDTNVHDPIKSAEVRICVISFIIFSNVLFFPQLFLSKNVNFRLMHG